MQEQGLIVVSALFAFEQGDRAQIKAQMQELNAKRREKQPFRNMEVQAVLLSGRKDTLPVN